MDWSLVELNKVIELVALHRRTTDESVSVLILQAISLAGLTVLILSFLPWFQKPSREMLFLAMNMLWLHGIYSIFKFYSFSIQRFLADKGIKKLSVLLAVAGQLVLSGGYFGFLSYRTLLLGGIGLGMAHFWTMEVDYKYVLQVRPFAYLPFVLAPIAILYELFM